MIVLIESVILCIVFTIMVYVMSRNPITTLYNYPPKIQERVKSMKEYKDKIPTTKNKIWAKGIASIIIVVIVSLILRYINNYTTFLEAFLNGYLIWTIVNIYDVIVMDIIWFCHSKEFVFKGTEDMEKEYKDYFFHVKGAFIGIILGLIVALSSGCIIHLIFKI